MLLIYIVVGGSIFFLLQKRTLYNLISLVVSRSPQLPFPWPSNTDPLMELGLIQSISLSGEFCVGVEYFLQFLRSSRQNPHNRHTSIVEVFYVLLPTNSFTHVHPLCHTPLIFGLLSLRQIFILLIVENFTKEYILKNS